MDKVKVPMARFSPGPGQLTHYTCVGNMLLLAPLSALGDMVALPHSLTAAGEQRLEWWQCQGQRLRRLWGQRGPEAETGLLHADSL